MRALPEDVQRFIQVLKDNSTRCIPEGRPAQSCPNPNRQNTKPAGESLSYCARYVGAALVESGLAERYPERHAINYHEPFYDHGAVLPNLGFENIIADLSVENREFADPSQIPIGAIIVYEGGSYGHIEVKTDTGYISDFVAEQPLSQSNHTERIRTPVGVYLPPGVPRSSE